ncbi:MAG: transposase [Patescibacteria group bacterium]
MQRKYSFTPENYYHIYNRGIEKRAIFIDRKDYERFLIYLYLCNNISPVDIRNLYSKGLSFAEIMSISRKDTLVEIGAYCLMPNHVHLLVREKKDGGITNFTKKLFTGYSMYFNKKNQRTGRLFENIFKAEYINQDRYLKYLFVYIHLNPVKLIEPQWKEKGIKNFKKVEEFLNHYPWSSFHLYNKNLPDSIIDKKNFPEYFENSKEFKVFLDDWLNFTKDRPL